MVPRGNIYVRHGSTVDLMCKLNSSHSMAADMTSHHLDLMIDNEIASEVERPDDTTIRLSLPNLPVKPNTDSTYCRVDCLMDGALTCSRAIYVGSE